MVYSMQNAKNIYDLMRPVTASTKVKQPAMNSTIAEMRLQSMRVPM